MTDQIPEGQIPKPENLQQPKPAPEKAIEAPIGQAEQAIVNRIDQDGDEDKVLQDIAGEPKVSPDRIESQNNQDVFLFRYENPNSENRNPNSSVSQDELVGSWFTDSPSSLRDYIKKKQPGGNIRVLGIAEDKLEALKAINHPVAKSMDIEPIDNYIIPEELQTTARTFPLEVATQNPNKFLFGEWRKIDEAVDNLVTQIKSEEGTDLSIDEGFNFGEIKSVLSSDEISQRIQEQMTDSIGFLTLEDMERRRQELRSRPQLSAGTLYDSMINVDQNGTFKWVDLTNVVGRTFETPDGWADENESRKGRIASIGKAIIDSREDPRILEEIFHYQKPNERIQMVAIEGPAGPIYEVTDGQHRVSGSLVAGLSEIPAEVKQVKYPLEQSVDIKELGLIADWKILIEKGLIDGDLQDYESGGRQMKKLTVRSEVLPWIRTQSQTDLIKISKVYEQLYPGSLDNLPIPKQALLDPIANNFYMADRWREWLERSKN